MLRTTALASGLLLALATFLPAHVTLRSPLGGEAYGPGMPVTIEWEVLIQHSTNAWDLEVSFSGAAGPWVSIATGLPAGAIQAGARHSYTWITPLQTSGTVRVRVRQVNFGQNYESMSRSDFSIGVPFGADRYEISGSTGGVQGLQLDFGRGEAGQGYRVAGSLSGTAPGIPFQGQLVPLVPDDYFFWSLANPFGGILDGGAGQLDGQGRAICRVQVPVIPTPLPPTGVTVHHAAVVIDALGNLRIATWAVPLTLLP